MSEEAIEEALKVYREMLMAKYTPARCGGVGVGCLANCSGMLELMAAFPLFPAPAALLEWWTRIR